MRNTLSIASFSLLLFVMCACSRHYVIEDRARKQSAVSLADLMAVEYPGYHDLKIQDMKTIYVNDSICLLQFSARFKKSDNNDWKIDYRYTYLLDMLQSYSAHKAIFSENYENILCMPNDLIRQCKRDIKTTGESVYTSQYNSVRPVSNPFDQ